jgi:Tol biopolymer transport system component/tRNA A-37 threonylcarbamoyl transferase component Bud32
MTPPDGTPSPSGRPPEALTIALEDRYRIERELGQGGMATVYLAYDVRHDRKVALKVLRPELAAILGAERFLAEIKTTANLQHPHILSLFDSGEAGGLVYYVMPFVDGESLRDRLAREHQLPVDEAVRIAREVADALHYAHGLGIVHRDIKPENILLHGGHALVADFGIALAVSRSDGGTRMTETGMSLGTPHYMAPEQAMGEREITPRADIYALACVTYEMLTGEPPFTGATAQAIVARVVTESPRSLSTQRRTIPPHVEAAVLTALEKLPADRFASAAEFVEALDGKAIGRYDGRTVATPAGARVPSSRLVAGLAGLAVVTTALAAWGWLRSAPAATRPVLRYQLGLDQAEGFQPGTDLVRVALSPDGSRLVYAGPAEAGTQLLLRERSQLHATPIPNTSNARNPAFSPDGRRLAFLEAQNRVRVVSLDGSPPITVADTGVLGGGVAWGDDGFIYYDAQPGMSRVPEAGGAPEVVFPLDTAEAGQAWADVLPGGRGVVFRTRAPNASQDSYEIVAGRPGTGERHRLMRGVFARYLRSGHLLVVTAEGNLLAAPFDAATLKLTGPAVPLLEGIAVKSFGAVDLAVSASGTMVYRGGSTSELGSWTPVWVERGGRETPVEQGWTVEGAIPTRAMALSADGRRIALGVSNRSSGNDLWVKELPGGPFTRITFLDGNSYSPFWLPGGQKVGFLRDGLVLLAQRADGVGTPDTLASGGSGARETSISRDGLWLVWQRQDVQSAGGGWDIYGMRLGVDSAPRPLVTGAGQQLQPQLSPDGRWLAYADAQSSEAIDVYVRPFPEVDRGRWQVSLDGGVIPRWSPSGKELFFRRPGSGAITVARLRTEGAITVVDRSEFMPAPREGRLYASNYDVHPDGKRLLMMKRVTGDDEGGAGLIAVENFAGELSRKVPR